MLTCFNSSLHQLTNAYIKILPLSHHITPIRTIRTRIPLNSANFVRVFIRMTRSERKPNIPGAPRQQYHFHSWHPPALLLPSNSPWVCWLLLKFQVQSYCDNSKSDNQSICQLVTWKKSSNKGTSISKNKINGLDCSTQS